VGGWLSRRRGIPLLLLLAVIELLTGAFGLVSLHVFDKVGEVTIGMSLAATAAITLALVIVPTLLMGATLPLLVGHLVRRSGNVGSAVGLLYYVNTLGAGAACLACTVLLFPFVGMQGTVYFAAAVNAAVALGAFGAHWRDRRRSVSADRDAPASDSDRKPVLGLVALLAFGAAGGMIALSYEIFFFRTVSYATGSSPTAFALTLSVFLVGLASGARSAGERCAVRTHADVMQYAFAGLMKGSLVGLLFLPLLDLLSWLDRGIVGVAILMVYLFARFWGTLMPYLGELGIVADDRAGMRTALLYFANILGSTLGSIVTGFVLMEHVGLVPLAGMLAVASLVCAGLLIGALPIGRPQRWLRASGVVALGLLAVVALPRWSHGVLASLQWKGASEAREFASVVENRSGIVTATQDGIVFGNGMYDGRFNIDLLHDTNGAVRPYALSLFHRAPRNVLMLGLASGSWAQIIASNPDVASLTIVEINPGYLALIANEPQIASVLSSPKVIVIVDDGRRWLRANPARRFDAIVSNTTWHFRANASNLLSSEFLSLVKEHLNPGGVFFYNTTDSDRVQHTGCSVFKHGARFVNHLVVSETQIAWDFARWRRLLESYRIEGRPVFDLTRAEDRAELDRLVSWEESLALGVAYQGARPIEPCTDILIRTAGKRPVTDDNMGTEWRHSFGLE
jgi:predicted membrane-bound spermidine synthase